MTAILIKFNPKYIRNNIQSVAFLLTFILINVFLFISRLYEYSAFGWLVMLARANGQCLNFTSAFIIACVCRKSITKLRSKGFSEYLPLDHHVYYHKVTGWAIVFFSLFHTAMHVINFKILSKITTISWFDFLFSTYLGIGWIGGAACLTGWLLLALLIAMMIPAQPFMRRSGQFEVSPTFQKPLTSKTNLFFGIKGVLLHTSPVCPLLCVSLHSCAKLLDLVCFAVCGVPH